MLAVVDGSSDRGLQTGALRWPASAGAHVHGKQQKDGPLRDGLGRERNPMEALQGSAAAIQSVPWQVRRVTYCPRRIHRHPGLRVYAPNKASTK